MEKTGYFWYFRVGFERKLAIKKYLNGYFRKGRERPQQ